MDWDIESSAVLSKGSLQKKHHFFVTTSLVTTFVILPIQEGCGFVHTFFQASSGILMDQNKGFLPVLYSKVFEAGTCH